MVKNIFEYPNYRDFVTETLREMPSGGHGQLAKIAQSLNISPSIVTQVLQGKKDFTPEQAKDFCDYWGLSELETDLFLAFVQRDRAGKENLKSYWEKRISEIKVRSKDLKQRLSGKTEFDDSKKEEFYSQWYYSGIRVLCSIEEFQTVDRIANQLRLPRAVVKRVVDFLLQAGLCEEEDGRILVGPQSTHVEWTSPLVAKHHRNWRLKTLSRLDDIKADELCFTSPISIAKDDIPRVREVLVSAIEESFKIIDPSPAEEAAFINIDLLRF